MEDSYLFESKRDFPQGIFNAYTKKTACPRGNQECSCVAIKKKKKKNDSVTF